MGTWPIWSWRAYTSWSSPSWWRHWGGREPSAAGRPTGRAKWAQRHCAKTVHLIETFAFPEEHLTDYIARARQPNQILPITLWPCLVRLMDQLLPMCTGGFGCKMPFTTEQTRGVRETIARLDGEGQRIVANRALAVLRDTLHFAQAHDQPRRDAFMAIMVEQRGVGALYESTRSWSPSPRRRHHRPAASPTRPAASAASRSWWYESQQSGAAWWGSSSSSRWRSSSWTGTRRS